MQNEKRSNDKRTVKPLAVVLAVALLVICAVGGTLAWLTSSPDPITNTFTIGNVKIELDETDAEYKMVPGHTINKDPKVTVLKGSEDCWVFLEVGEVGVKDSESKTAYALSDFITYTIAKGWTPLTEGSKVYYREVKNITENQEFLVLGGGTYTDDNVTYKWKDNQVLTLPTVTKEMADFLQDNNLKPQLKFTAHAIQYWKNNTEAFTPAEAWELAKSGT